MVLPGSEPFRVLERHEAPDWKPWCWCSGAASFVGARRLAKNVEAGSFWLAASLTTQLNELFPRMWTYCGGVKVLLGGLDSGTKLVKSTLL